MGLHQVALSHCGFGGVLLQIWGVGPTTASKLYKEGYKSLEDLRKFGMARLSEQQRIGLRHLEDFEIKIPRCGWRPTTLVSMCFS
jgi:Fingers domain of DNA polymerase lambda